MKLAVFSPLPPAMSGIADYCQALLPDLARHFQLEVFVEDGIRHGGFPPDAQIAVRGASEFRPREFDAILYQLGNNPDHVHVYDAALKYPGIVVLHEFNLHHLVADATIKRGDWAAYLREVEHEGGVEARAYARRVEALEVGPDYDGLAMNRRILEGSRALIVHSRFMVDQVLSTGVAKPVAKIPHGAWIPEVHRNLRRAQLGLDESTPLIGIFGFLKPYKRITEALRAMQRLVRLDSRVRMIVVGQEHPDYPVRRLVEQLGLREHVRLLGYVPTEELEQYVAAADICLNLRYPTVGESSGTLLRALGMGRAVIVSDVGSFSELPPEICLKVPPGEGEIDLLFEYLNLFVSHPEAAREMGKRAREYVASECSWKRVAGLYAAWIQAVVEGRAQPGFHAAASAAQTASTSQTASAAQTTGAAQATAAAETVAGPAHAATGAAASPAEPETRPETSPVAEAQLEAAPPAADSSVPQPSRRLDRSGARELSAGEREALAGYIRGFVFNRTNDAVYVENHITRLVRTLEITPLGSARDSALEMGAYLHITPALKTRLGYGEVRGSYLGPLGKVDHRVVDSRDGEQFECDVDNFNAEKDSYPYADGHFATVLCCELLEHLYEDPMHMMAEINRITRLGGHLVLSTPNICSLRGVGAMLLGYHPGLFHHYIRPDKYGHVDPRHAREYAPRDVHALLEAAGFDIERLETGPYLERPSLEHEWVKQMLARYQLPDHLRGDAIYAVGRKTGAVRTRYPAGLYEEAAE